MHNFIGKDGFIWWVGVVERRDDPLGLGRCKVRIFGWHTDDLLELPTDALPWALPCNTPNNSNYFDVPREGEFVMGFFQDGLSAQAPIMMGTFSGIQAKSFDRNRGFSPQGPTTNIPSLPSGIKAFGVGEPNTPPLARGIVENTGVAKTNADVSSTQNWTEPVSAANNNTKPVYPYNQVRMTESGHTFEMDDTPSRERVRLQHRTGTFIEMHPNGDEVHKVYGNGYEITVSNKNVLIKGNCDITIEGDCNLNIGGNMTGKASSWNLTGDVNIEGTLNATGDVIGGGISLDNHVHGGVKSGGEVTGTPR